MVYGGHNTRDFTAVDQSSGSSHLAHNVIFEKRSGESYGMLASSMHRKRARENWTQYGPDSLPPDCFATSDKFFDLRITGHGVHTLRSTTVQLTVTNIAVASLPGVLPVVTGTAIPQIVPFFFNRIEVQPDGGSTEDTIYADQLYLDLVHLMTSEQKTTLCRSMAMSMAGPRGLLPNQRSALSCFDEDGLPMAPGETREFLFPVHTFLTQAHTYLPNKKQNPRLRFYCALNPICSDSNGGLLRLTGVEFVIGGLLYDKSVYVNLSQEYALRPSVSRVITHERQFLEVKGATPLEQINDQPLTVLNGSFAAFFVYLRRSDAVSEGRYASNRLAGIDLPGRDGSRWLPIARLSLVDSNGNPVGFHNISGQYLKSVVAAKSFPNTYFYSQKNIYPFVFTTDPMETYRHGSDHGGLILDSNFQLKLIPGLFDNTVPAPSYTAVVPALRYALFTRSTDGAFNIVKL